VAASVYDLLLWVPVELGTGYLSRLLGVAPGNYSRFSRIVDRGYDRDQSPINISKTRRSLFVIKYTMKNTIAVTRPLLLVCTSFFLPLLDQSFFK